MSAPPVALARRLHVRLTIVVLALLTLMGAVLLLLARQYSEQSALEATQRLNLDVARYIVEHQPSELILPDGQPDRALMEDLARHAMMINPAIEIYLLDAQGRIIGHALDEAGRLAERVDLAPVRQLAEPRIAAARLPLLGDDPREPGTRGIFAAAPVRRDGHLTGYLYVVLRGQGTQNLTDSLAASDTLREIAIGVGLATLFAGIVLVMALRKFTQPLRQLAAQVQAFRTEGDDRTRIERGDEIAVLRSATESMQQRIAQQFTRLEDRDRMLRELVSNISHDLHTPLASIQGYVETLLLRGEQLDAASREEYLKTVLRHSQSLGKRIADLFELSKLDAGRIAPKFEAFCLAELLQDVIQNYQLQAQQRGVRLRLSAGSHQHARVLADIALIERVVQNLIDNALRYTPRGGDIELAIAPQGPCLAVRVSDTGVGIAQEHLPHIFERYWRASEADDTAAGPTAGLGLAIVKRILDLHGCAVRVHSELMRGTRIEFALPAA